MQGYSVTEAASVLGVPTERVWELLARGILSGTSDGETGMRVFLQPRPAPAPAPAAAEPSPGNGGAREPERELSPFRELLTEFRNLTERYGQALLALGESRGEVAALRSRVDLLEARMDLRLSSEAAAPAWPSTPMPLPTERQVATGAAQRPLAGAESERVDEEEDHRARRRGPRRATQSFAEALARAEDPSIPELPGRAGAAAPASQVEVTLPRDAAIAEPMPLPEEPKPPSAEPVIAAEAQPLSEPETRADAAAVVPEIPTEEDDDGERGDERVAAVVGEADVAPAEPIDFDADRYTTDIEEPDWLEAEAFDLEEHTGAAEMEIAAGRPAAALTDAPEVEPPSGDREAGTPLPGADELDQALRALGVEPLSSLAAEDAERAVPPAAEPTEDGGANVEPTEEDAPESGTAEPAPSLPETEADDREASGPATRPSDAPDEASAIDRQADPDERPGAGPEVEPEWPPRAQHVFEPRPSSESLSRRPSSPMMRGPTSPFGTSPAPASRAYRRLRRIFPG